MPNQYQILVVMPGVLVVPQVVLTAPLPVTPLEEAITKKWLPLSKSVSKLWQWSMEGAQFTYVGEGITSKLLHRWYFPSGSIYDLSISEVSNWEVIIDLNAPETLLSTEKCLSDHRLLINWGQGIDHLPDHVEQLMTMSGATPIIDPLTVVQNQLRQVLADYQNLQKEQQRQMNMMTDIIKRDIFKQLIDLFGDLSVAIKHGQEQVKDHPWLEGILQVVAKYQQILTQNGIKEINPEIGSVLNYEECQIVGTVNNSDKPNTIVNVVQPGYRTTNHVISTAKVIVGVQNTTN